MPLAAKHQRSLHQRLKGRKGEARVVSEELTHPDDGVRHTAPWEWRTYIPLASQKDLWEDIANCDGPPMGPEEASQALTRNMGLILKNQRTVLRHADLQLLRGLLIQCYGQPGKGVSPLVWLAHTTLDFSLAVDDVVYGTMSSNFDNLKKVIKVLRTAAVWEGYVDLPKADTPSLALEHVAPVPSFPRTAISEAVQVQLGYVPFKECIMNNSTNNAAEQVLDQAVDRAMAAKSSGDKAAYEAAIQEAVAASVAMALKEAMATAIAEMEVEADKVKAEAAKAAEAGKAAKPAASAAADAAATAAKAAATLAEVEAEKPSTLKRVATTTAKVAVVAGVGYGAYRLARGQGWFGLGDVAEVAAAAPEAVGAVAEAASAAKEGLAAIGGLFRF